MPPAATVRELVRLRVAEQVPDFEGRVYEPEMADPTGAFPGDTAYPYAVVRLGAEPEMLPWGFRALPVEVWPFVAPDSHQALDELGRAVDAALAYRVFAETGAPTERYYAVPMGTATQDTPDVTSDGRLRALTRPRRYGLAAVNRGLGTAHPALEAIATDVGAVFPSLQAGLDFSTEVPTDDAPSVLFRFRSLPGAGDWETLDYRWMACEVAGHVLAPSPATREQWVTAINTHLAQSFGLPFADGSSAVQVDPRPADVTADPLQDGQLRLDARYLTTATEDLPLLPPDPVYVEHAIGTAPVSWEADAP